MKTKTALDKRQQAITRLFLEEVLTQPKLVGNRPADARQAIAFVMSLLGYQVLSNGNCIPLGEEVKTSYGAGLVGNAYDEYDDHYEQDGKEIGEVVFRYRPSPGKPPKSV